MAKSPPLKHSSWVVVANGRGKDKKYLVGKRGKKANNAGQWGFFGGTNDPGEHPKESALREFHEEAGHKIDRASYMGTHKTKPKHSHYFFHRSDEQFTPKTNYETAKTDWVSAKKLKKMNLHASVKDYFAHVKPNRLAANIVKKAAQKSIEIKASNDPYGHWFDHTGKTHEVNDVQGHEKTALKHIHNDEHLDEQYENFPKSQHTNPASAFMINHHGWTRTVTEKFGGKNHLGLQFRGNSLSKNTAKSLLKHIAQNNHHSYFVDINDKDNPHAQKNHVLRGNEGKEQTKKLIHENVKHNIETKADLLVTALNSFGYKRLKYDANSRQKSADKGTALPDGSFPINDAKDLQSAVRNWGRANNPNKAKRWIIKRARALKLVDKLPEKWAVTASLHNSYWINSEGKLLLTEDEHEVAAQKYIKQKLILNTNKKLGGIITALDQGWIRAIISGELEPEISVEFDKNLVSKLAINTAIKLAKEQQFYKYYLTTCIVGEFSLKKSGTNIFDKLSKFNIELRKYPITNRVTSALVKPKAKAEDVRITPTDYDLSHITSHIALHKTTASIAAPEIGGIHHGITYDQKNGLGNVPDNQQVNYKGFSVYMKPSQFLKLTPKRNHKLEDSNIKHIETAIRTNKPIASPFLDVTFDEKYKKPAKIRQHEGRTRMEAIRRVHGDVPVLVHIFAGNGMRARHISNVHIKAFQAAVVPEKKARAIKGPHFDDHIHVRDQWHNINELPPFQVKSAVITNLKQSDSIIEDIMAAQKKPILAAKINNRELETTAIFGAIKRGLQKLNHHITSGYHRDEAQRWNNIAAKHTPGGEDHEIATNAANRHTNLANEHANKIHQINGRVKGAKLLSRHDIQKHVEKTFPHINEGDRQQIGNHLHSLQKLHATNKHNTNDRSIIAHNHEISALTGSNAVMHPKWAPALKHPDKHAQINTPHPNEPKTVAQANENLAKVKRNSGTVYKPKENPKPKAKRVSDTTYKPKENPKPKAKKVRNVKPTKAPVAVTPAKPKAVKTPKPANTNKIPDAAKEHHDAIKSYTKLKNKHTKILNGVKDALKNGDLDKTARAKLKQKHTEHFNTLKTINRGIKDHTAKLHSMGVAPPKPKAKPVTPKAVTANINIIEAKRSVLRAF